MIIYLVKQNKKEKSYFKYLNEEDTFSKCNLTVCVIVTLSSRDQFFRIPHTKIGY